MQALGQPTPNRIEEIWNDHKELTDFLQSHNQLSLLTRVEGAFSKTLIVAVASYFEVRLTQVIIDLFREATDGAEALAEFVRNQAIGTRFAQLFDWGGERGSSRNANSFYVLFGREFRENMRARVEGNQSLDNSVQAFLEIGNLRNLVVHRNYADFPLDKTVEEIFELYQSGIRFLDEFPNAIREFIALRGSFANP